MGYLFGDYGELVYCKSRIAFVYSGTGMALLGICSQLCRSWYRHLSKCEMSSDKKVVSVFLAGGITNCPDWQAEAAIGVEKRLTDENNDVTTILYNPRRRKWLPHHTLEKQIEWEHTHLEAADIILFWFPAESMCPITLFELGKCAMWKPNKMIFVGCHEDYCRKKDIVKQLQLIRPEIQVTTDFETLLDHVCKAIVVEHKARF